MYIHTHIYIYISASEATEFPFNGIFTCLLLLYDSAQNSVLSITLHINTSHTQTHTHIPHIYTYMFPLLWEKRYFLSTFSSYSIFL